MPHADPTAGQAAVGAPAAAAVAVAAPPVGAPLVVAPPVVAPPVGAAAGVPPVGAPAGLDHPTPEPPDGADPLLWRLAYGLHRDHRPDVDGSCVTCRTSFPCPPRGLADRGFAAAMVPREAPSG